MGRSNLYLSGIAVALFIPVIVAVSCPFGSSRVDTICELTSCTPNSVCRVVKSSNNTYCPPQAACIKCAPIGVDDVCHKNHYYYAVLVGLVSDIRSLSELKCDITGLGKRKCPAGSTCLPDAKGSGTCCYQEGYPPDDVNIVRINHTICPDKCGGCKSDYICKLVVHPCLIPPCPTEYRCVERERSCPVLPAYVPDYCNTVKRQSQCSSDRDCPGKLLCCSDLCSNRYCTRGL